MTKNLQFKFLLVGLWLLCYMPFKKSFVAGESQKATLHLGDLERVDDQETYDRWQDCLAYLNEHDINCSIRVKCQSNNFEDPKFFAWLTMLEGDGHHIIHDENCVCGSSHMGYQQTQQSNMLGFSEAFRPMFVSQKEDPNLVLSLPSDFFKYQFKSLAKRSNYFIIEGDPTSWSHQQFLHFQQNIQYLILEGIKFDNP